MNDFNKYTLPFLLIGSLMLIYGLYSLKKYRQGYGLPDIKAKNLYQWFYKYFLIPGEGFILPNKANSQNRDQLKYFVTYFLLIPTILFVLLALKIIFV